MMYIPDQPFNIVSKSENQHILTIIYHLTGLLDAFPIPDKMTDTIVYIFIKNYLPVHMHPIYIPSDNGTELKNLLMDDILQQHCIDQIITTLYHP